MNGSCRTITFTSDGKFMFSSGSKMCGLVLLSLSLSLSLSFSLSLITSKSSAVTDLVVLLFCVVQVTAMCMCGTWTHESVCICSLTRERCTWPLWLSLLTDSSSHAGEGIPLMCIKFTSPFSHFFFYNAYLSISYDLFWALQVWQWCAERVWWVMSHGVLAQAPQGLHEPHHSHLSGLLWQLKVSTERGK